MAHQATPAPAPQGQQQQRQGGFSPVTMAVFAFLAWRFLFGDSDDKQLKKETLNPSPIQPTFMAPKQFNAFDHLQLNVGDEKSSPVKPPRSSEVDEFDTEDSGGMAKKKADANPHYFDVDAVGGLDDLDDVKVIIRFDQQSENIANGAVELKKFLEVNYPQTIGNILGVYAPVPEWVQRLSGITGILQMAGLFLTFAGKRVFGEENRFIQAFHKQKMQVFMLVMGLNLGSGFLQFTGEFDIEVNGKLLFSKKQEDRFPTGQEIVDLLYEQGIKRKRVVEITN